MKTSGILGALLLVWASCTMAQSSSYPNGEFSGLVYSDYYWMVSSHNDDIEGENGFWLRRVYLTYDYQISDAVSGRFRLEGNSPGDFISDAKIRPVVKDLYLRWEHEQHLVEVGISSTPTFGFTEDVWGYRSVEKSPQDLLGFGSSRDFGISLEGDLDPKGKLNYHFMFGNGNSNSSEINKGKKFMLSLAYELTDNFVVEAYGDYNDNTGDEDWYTMQGFAGYQSEDLNMGALYTRQTRQRVVSTVTGTGTTVVQTVTTDLDIASVFANFRLTDAAKGFLRIDKTFDAIPGVNNNDYFPISSQTASTIFIAGVDFDLNHNIHLMPNIEASTYEESELNGNTPDNTFLPRLTLEYQF